MQFQFPVITNKVLCNCLYLTMLTYLSLYDVDGLLQLHKWNSGRFRVFLVPRSRQVYWQVCKITIVLLTFHIISGYHSYPTTRVDRQGHIAQRQFIIEHCTIWTVSLANCYARLQSRVFILKARLKQFFGSSDRFHKIGCEICMGCIFINLWHSFSRAYGPRTSHRLITILTLLIHCVPRQVRR